jgi:protein TonB
MRRADLTTLALALVVHAGLAVALVKRAGDRRALARPRPRPVEVDFGRIAAPVAPAPPAPERALPSRGETPRRPPRKLAMRARPQPRQATPPPSVASSPPAAAPPPARPMFGVSMDSTTDAPSAIAAAAGGVGIADPSRRGPPGGGAVGTAPAAVSGYAPVSELEVKTMPDIDADACGRTVTYPADAEKNGIEGDVRLRVELDEGGRVRGVRVLSGLGHGLDQVAVEALKHRCKFTPARDRAGAPVAFVVQSYTFHFELPR